MEELLNIPLLIVILYICCLMVISVLAAKLVKKETMGFLLASRTWPWYMVAFMLTANAVGGTSTVGCAQTGFESGIAAGWYTVAWGLGALLMGFFGASRWRGMKFYTVPEMFGSYYTMSARIVAVILQFMITMTIACLQFVAHGALLAAMLPNYFSLFSGILLTAIIFVGIALLGGYKAGGLISVLNVGVIYFGILVGVIASWSFAGGTETIVSKLPSGINYFSLFESLGFGVVLGWIIVMGFQAFSSQSVVQISLAAKSPHAAKWGFIVGAILMAPVGFLAAYMGIAAKSLYPNIPSVDAMPVMIMKLHPVLAGITLAGMWAAGITTGVALLISSATLLEKDIYETYLDSRGLKISEEKAYKASRYLVLAVGVIGFFMALKATSLINVLTTLVSLCAPFTFIFLFTAYLPGFCKKGAAFWTILVGGIIVALWILVPAIRIVPHAIYLECLITFPMFIVLCLTLKDPLTRNNVS